MTSLGDGVVRLDLFVKELEIPSRWSLWDRFLVGRGLNAEGCSSPFEVEAAADADGSRSELFDED